MAQQLANDTLRKSFLWAFGVSFALMSIAQYLNWNVIALVAFPVFIMLLYLIFFLKSEHKELYRGQFADSFYSLGFLLTLSALILTFIPFLSGAREITVEGTLGNFGVALFTTLLGLSVRIWMTSFSPDLEDFQREAASTLERDVRSFQREMQASIETMNDFNEELGKTAKNMVDEFGKSMADAGKDITQIVDKSMKDALAPLEKTLNALSDNVEKATTDFSADLDQAFEECVASVNAIKLEPNLLGDALGPVLDNFDKAVGDIETSVRDVAASLGKSSEELDSAMADFSSSIGVLNQNLLGSIEKMTKDLEGLELDHDIFNRMLEDAFSEFKSAVNEVAAQIREHGSILEESSDAVGSALPAFGDAAEAIQGMADRSKELEDSVNQASDVSGRFGDIARELENLASKTREYVSTIEDSVGIHRTSSRNLDSEREEMEAMYERLWDESERILDSIDHLSKTFVGIANFVKRELILDEEDLSHGQAKQ